jgi:hypothetical protein
LAAIAASCGGSSSTDPSVSPTPGPTSGPPREDRFSDSIPDRDLIDLATRFRGLPEGSERIASEVPFDYGIGQAEEFLVFDLSDEPDVVSVIATLRHVTDHAYFFVQSDRRVSQDTIETIGSDFETLVYPTVTEAFGQEWTPGVDSDQRMTILHVDLKGAGGYYSGADEFPRTVVPLSNEREMMTLYVDILNNPGVAYNAIAAHELQHMIHWHADFSEESWVNEGLSQVAAELVGGGSDWLDLYLSTPDIGLIDWPEIGQSAVHYAASELFFSYLLDQYGGRESAVTVLAEPLDGIEGVQSYLDEFAVRFDDVFADWLAATYLDNESGPYAHVGSDTSSISREVIDSLGAGDGSVSQFGADFLEIDVPEHETEFIFDGAENVTPLAAEIDGAYYWSNQGEVIDSRMTTELDLSTVESATLTFDVWYEIERGWDYAYVAASTDDGATWEALKGSHTSDYDPVGQAYGDGYTGSSDGWVEESIDLSDYAGGTVLIRFEYVTDDSTNLAGFAVDNIEVAEIGYRADGDDPAGLVGEGFQIVNGPMAQEWLIQVIDRDTSEVERIELDEAHGTTIALSAPSTVIISGISQDTPAKTDYSWSLTATE